MSNHPNWRLPEVPAFSLESPDFADGEKLPDWARADGGNRQPTLRWSGAPEGTKSFVITVFEEGERLMSQATGQGAIEIFREAPDRFFLRVVDAP